MIEKNNFPKTGILLCIAGAIMLPSIGIGIWIISDFVESVMLYFGSENTYGLSLQQFISIDLEKLAIWIIPLFLGVIIASIGIKRRKPVPGAISGIIVIIAFYLFFIWDYERGLSECITKLPACGDMSFLAYPVYAGLCIINTLAVLGLTLLMVELTRIRKSKRNIETQGR